MKLKLLLLVVVLTWVDMATSQETVEEEDEIFIPDPNGYLLFCLCMGRFGNQAEHFLGGLRFAKNINRTLILPPWRTYLNVEFDEWFKVEAFKDFHRVILAKDFMKHLAPTVWPPSERKGFCYQVGETPCEIKVGNPFTNFWDELNVDFAEIVGHSIPYRHPEAWQRDYPPDKYPVIAMRGAPASFPMDEGDVELQKLFVYSDKIKKEAEELLIKHFGSAEKDYVGIHLRNGADWTRTCDHVKQAYSKSHLMASYQCQGFDYKVELTKEMCLGGGEAGEVVERVAEVVRREGVGKVLVATDRDPMVEALRRGLPGVRVERPDPWLPVVDTFLLAHGRHFVGNCVSSFSAFVSRHRRSHALGPTSYFGTHIQHTTQKTEL